MTRTDDHWGAFFLFAIVAFLLGTIIMVALGMPGEWGAVLVVLLGGLTAAVLWAEDE